MENADWINDQDGVSVFQDADGGYLVTFEFDRQLAKEMRNVPNAVFDPLERCYLVPAEQGDVLQRIVKSMRRESVEIQLDLVRIKDLAIKNAQATQSDQRVKPMVSCYIEPGRFYGGEVINASSRFVAQSNGFGKENGAAFVSIHRIADLSRGRIFKGERIGITYDSKFHGNVVDLPKDKSDAQLEAEFQSSLGKEVDGVTLTDRGGSIGVAFALNPALLARVRRVEGAMFNREDKVWELPKEQQVFALRTAHSMRNDFVLDGKEIDMLRSVAADKLDGAKVSKAFNKEGFEHFGQVLAVGDRYALQKSGQDRFVLHSLVSLSAVPEVGQNISVTYSRGLGQVVDLDLQRAKTHALGR